MDSFLVVHSRLCWPSGIDDVLAGDDIVTVLTECTCYSILLAMDVCISAVSVKYLSTEWHPSISTEGLLGESTGS